MKINFDLVRMLLLGALCIALDEDIEYTDKQKIYHWQLLKGRGYITDAGLTNLGLDAANLMRDGVLWRATSWRIAESRFDVVPLSVVLEMLRQEMIAELRG